VYKLQLVLHFTSQIRLRVCYEQWRIIKPPLAIAKAA